MVMAIAERTNRRERQGRRHMMSLFLVSSNQEPEEGSCIASQNDISTYMSLRMVGLWHSAPDSQDGLDPSFTMSALSRIIVRLPVRVQTSV